MSNLSETQKIHYTLRIASAMCLIGHGAFGIITKPIWCNYFAVFGIGQDLAYRLMPLVGSFDIFLGILILVYPVRVIPAWLVVWGILTASLRPLSGEPFAEFIERAGNFGAPLVLLVVSGGPGQHVKNIFTPLSPGTPLDAKARGRLVLILRVTAFLLLLGHGWLNVIGKKGLLGQYASLGFTDAGRTALVVGVFEMVAALVVLIRPIRPMLLVLLAWKMTSELFYPHYELFEWIERGGSYGVLLALWFALDPGPLPAAGRKNFSGKSSSKPVPS